MSNELSRLEVDILIQAALEEGYTLPKSLEHRVAVIHLTEAQLLDFNMWVDERPHYVPTRAGYLRGQQEREKRG